MRLGDNLPSSDAVITDIERKGTNLSTGKTVDRMTNPSRVKAAASGDEPIFLPEPREFEDLDVGQSLLMDLALKEIYFAGQPTAIEISRALALPFTLTQQILDTARGEHFVQTVKSDGYFEQKFQYGLTERGQEKVKECLARSQYRGPVPVPFAQYCDVVRMQTIRTQTVTREDVQRSLGDLVLSRRVLDEVGPGINSGTCLFLYGASGNGKTSIATHLKHILSGPVLIPYALEINGQIVKVLDPTVHEVMSSDDGAGARAIDPKLIYGTKERSRDLRWAVCSRPLVIVGGELTLDKLEFQYDPHLRYHQAPLHMKAAGGLFVIDDFGRQRASPRDILNRWIVPMDRGVDYLPLPTGGTVEVPFDLLLIFSTNLRPSDVVDEAFLRRLRHKVFIPSPTLEQFNILFCKEASARGIAVTQELIDHIVDRYYRQESREMRYCHARDILSNVEDILRYESDSSALTLETLVRAADAYFRFEFE